MRGVRNEKEVKDIITLYMGTPIQVLSSWEAERESDPYNPLLHLLTGISRRSVRNSGQLFRQRNIRRHCLLQTL